MSVKFTGKVHPYIEDLPIFEDKVDEIAESIDEVGLLHPVTIDSEGQVIGGRHRLAACEVAGIDPTFEVWEGDPLAFMLHDNDARKHQTTGQLAAEKALTLDSAGRRQDNGRWKRGTVGLVQEDNRPGSVISDGWEQALRRAGLVLDVLGRDALMAIAAGDAELKPVYEQAQSEKDRRERERREREEFEANQAKNEADAEAFFQGKEKATTWYQEQPEGKYQTWLEAKNAYLIYDKEQAWEEEKARREEAQRQREIEASYDRDANRLKGFLAGYGQAWSMRDHPERDKVLNRLDAAERKRFIAIEGEITWPATKQ